MDERDIRAGELARNKFLQGLVENHGYEAVEAAARIALGYPARMITTHREASDIASQIMGANHAS